MSRLIQSVFAASLAVVAQISHAQALDVSGIKAGIPISTARSMAAKINPAYKVEDLRLATGKVVGFRAAATPAGMSGPNDQLIVIATDAGAVWFIGRQQNYAQGSRIAFEDVEKALKAKYGEPLDTNTIGMWAHRWEFYRDGRPHVDKRAPKPCQGIVNWNSWTKLPGTDITVLDRFSPQCGTLVISEEKFDNDDRMVTQLITKVVNESLIFDEINKKDTALQNEKQRQLQQEKAAGNKPQL